MLSVKGNAVGTPASAEAPAPVRISTSLKLPAPDPIAVLSILAETQARSRYPSGASPREAGSKKAPYCPTS